MGGSEALVGAIISAVAGLGSAVMSSRSAKKAAIPAAPEPPPASLAAPPEIPAMPEPPEPVYDLEAEEAARKKQEKIAQMAAGRKQTVLTGLLTSDPEVKKPGLKQKLGG